MTTTAPPPLRRYPPPRGQVHADTSLGWIRRLAPIVLAHKFTFFGTLALALVANLLQAELLVILSVVDGLCRADPGPDGRGEVVPLVRDLDEATLGLQAFDLAIELLLLGRTTGSCTRWHQ